MISTHWTVDSYSGKRVVFNEDLERAYGKPFPSFLGHAIKKKRLPINLYCDRYYLHKLKKQWCYKLGLLVDNYVIHHHYDGKTVLLMSKQVHSSYYHAGGMYILKQAGFTTGR